MFEQFRSVNLREDTLARIQQANDIIEEYDGQRLTARQIYYQFVARDLIPNTPRSYQNITAMLTTGRYAGLVSWEAIEDRGRQPDVPSDWPNIDSIVDAAVRQFRLPRWENQPSYVELWVEKQALAGVLGPIAFRHHVPLMVNKGYSSASAMYAAAQRMIENGGDGEKESIVLYLGDHDPSGKDMIRDIRDRLTEFGVMLLDVRAIALTTAQVRHFKPPPNPAKLTDSRAKGYIAEFGRQSWELDALPPRELNRIVERAITDIVDEDLMAGVIEIEDAERRRVSRAIEKSRKGSKK